MRLGLIVVGLFIGLQSLLAAAPAKPGPKIPPLKTSDPEDTWLFGYIPKDAWVCHHYLLANPHGDTVTIVKIEAGCDCTHPPRPPIEIAPGESCLFQVLFDTRTYFGETNRDIHLVTDYKPNPEMDLYFMSVASRDPYSITITPQSCAFIPGKTEQEFVIKNLKEDKTDFFVSVDNDSSLAVSDTAFSLQGKAEKVIRVVPLWDRLATGSHYRSLALDVSRPGEYFRVAIPVKLNKL